MKFTRKVLSDVNKKTLGEIFFIYFLISELWRSDMLLNLFRWRLIQSKKLNRATNLQHQLIFRNTGNKNNFSVRTEVTLY